MPTPPPGRDSFVGYDAGDVIAGKYRLVRKLGQGGVGTVWLSRNIVLDAVVAIKLIRPGLDAPDAADRLLKEARAEAKLEHPAIVRVFDFGETEHGQPFIVMELLEGQDLGDALDESERLEPRKAVQILLPVIEALASAHDQGIVHRDLKPENIFLAKEGKKVQPKVVDFGIAKLTQNDVVLTRVGAVLGTPAYMAPEQARGDDDVDHRVDTWAISLVLYESIVGERPFRGDNYNAVLRAVIEDDIAPFEKFGIIEPELWRIVRVGMKKERLKRWQSMRELGTALAAWLLRQGVTQDVTGDSLQETWLSGGSVAELTEEQPVSSEGPAGVRESGLPHSVDVNGPHAALQRRRRRGAGLALGAVAIAAGVLWLKGALESSQASELSQGNLVKLGSRMTPPDPLFREPRASRPPAEEPRSAPAVPAPSKPSASAPQASAVPARVRAPSSNTAAPGKPASTRVPVHADAGTSAPDPGLDLKDPY
ncbi:MAG TPA: protein kinase [Polyangiaceae bacterium]|nr:protein kinase [Polyangiaceae bacterium]